MNNKSPSLKASPPFRTSREYSTHVILNSTALSPVMSAYDGILQKDWRYEDLYAFKNTTDAEHSDPVLKTNIRCF